MTNQLNETLPERSRIEEIEADLMAYKLGWMSYDREHVRQLQAERIALMNAAKTAD